MSQRGERYRERAARRAEVGSGSTGHGAVGVQVESKPVAVGAPTRGAGRVVAKGTVQGPGKDLGDAWLLAVAVLEEAQRRRGGSDRQVW